MASLVQQAIMTQFPIALYDKYTLVRNEGTRVNHYIPSVVAPFRVVENVQTLHHGVSAGTDVYGTGERQVQSAR